MSLQLEEKASSLTLLLKQTKMNLKAPNNLESVKRLSDWELIIAFSFCHLMLDKATPEAIEEFDQIRDFFHDGDEIETVCTLHRVMAIYKQEYDKRHCN